MLCAQYVFSLAKREVSQSKRWAECSITPYLEIQIHPCLSFLIESQWFKKETRAVYIENSALGSVPSVSPWNQRFKGMHFKLTDLCHISPCWCLNSISKEQCPSGTLTVRSLQIRNSAQQNFLAFTILPINFFSSHHCLFVIINLLVFKCRTFKHQSYKM